MNYSTLLIYTIMAISLMIGGIWVASTNPYSRESQILYFTGALLLLAIIGYGAWIFVMDDNCKSRETK